MHTRINWVFCCPNLVRNEFLVRLDNVIRLNLVAVLLNSVYYYLFRSYLSLNFNASRDGVGMAKVTG